MLKSKTKDKPKMCHTCKFELVVLSVNSIENSMLLLELKKFLSKEEKVRHMYVNGFHLCEN